MLEVEVVIISSLFFSKTLYSIDLQMRWWQDI